MAGGTLPGKSRCRSLPSSVRREDKGAAHVGLGKTARSIYPLEGRSVARPGFISSSRAEAEDLDAARTSSFAKIGRAHVCTPVYNSQFVYRIRLTKKQNNKMLTVRQN